MKKYYINCTNMDSCSQVFSIDQKEYEQYDGIVILCPDCHSAAILSVDEPLELNLDEKQLTELIKELITIIEKIKEKK